MNEGNSGRWSASHHFFCGIWPSRVQVPLSVQAFLPDVTQAILPPAIWLLSSSSSFLAKTTHAHICILTAPFALSCPSNKAAAIVTACPCFGLNCHATIYLSIVLVIRICSLNNAHPLQLQLSAHVPSLPGTCDMFWSESQIESGLHLPLTAPETQSHSSTDARTPQVIRVIRQPVGSAGGQSAGTALL